MDDAGNDGNEDNNGSRGDVEWVEKRPHSRAFVFSQVHEKALADACVGLGEVDVLGTTFRDR